jgi:tetratricopeptide (TPR) repeat protein
LTRHSGATRTLSPSPFLRARALLLLATIVLVAACGGKPEDQQATDELNAGLAASTAGKTDEAKAHYLTCLKHNSQNEFCIYNLGVLAMRAGSLLEAENDYRLALLIDPEFPSALFNLGYIQSQAGNDVATQEAIRLFQHFVQLRPADAGGHLNLGVLLVQTGNATEGKAEIALATTLDPSITVPPLPSPSLAPSSSPAPTAAPSPSSSG